MKDEALWAKLLAMELSDRVVINERPQGGTLKSRACFIEGFSHDYDFGPQLTWTTSLLLSLA